MNIKEFVFQTLNPRISPMVYIMMFVNLLIGIFFLTGFQMAGNESILYSAGTLVIREAWGTALTATSAIALYGMIWDKDWATQLGGIGGFMLWTFASISLILGGYIYVLLTVALFHLLFHGYVYLASTTEVLYRTAIRR